jgi:hypothetical protein
MLLVWLTLCSLFFIVSEWLLITLLLLEIITFYILSMLSIHLVSIVMSDFLIICFFRVFVIEGVIALSGLIILVTFRGSDYLRSSSILKC